MKKTTKKTAATKTPASTASATTVAKTPVAVKAAPAPVSVAPPVPSTAAKPAPTKSPIVTAAAPITIEAKIDVGYGNNLFVRGEGEGLSWDHGVPLQCVDSKTWRLTVPAKDKLQFKLLLNDTVWAKGEDVVAAPGKKVEVVPSF